MSQNSALPSYSAIYAFGDSLSDAGNVSITTSAAGATEPVSPPYYKEQYGPIAATCSATDQPGCRTSPSPSASARSRPAWPAARTSRMGAPKPGRRRRTQATRRFWRSRCRRRSGSSRPRCRNHHRTRSIHCRSGRTTSSTSSASPGLTAQQQTTDVDDAVANEISFVNSSSPAVQRTWSCLTCPISARRRRSRRGWPTAATRLRPPSIPRPRNCQRVQHGSHQPTRHD